jgi:hypothetical protein
MPLECVLRAERVDIGCSSGCVGKILPGSKGSVKQSEVLKYQRYVMCGLASGQIAVHKVLHVDE